MDLSELLLLNLKKLEYVPHYWSYNIGFKGTVQGYRSRVPFKGTVQGYRLRVPFKGTVNGYRSRVLFKGQLKLRYHSL